jgi:exodeoxyribonuclease-5
MVGDRLVCIRNDRLKKIFNGGLFDVIRAQPHPDKGDCVRLTLASEDFPTRSALTVTVREEFFTGGSEDIDWRELRGQQQFNYGYALTVHKAQGSQWNDVVLFDESRVFGDDRQRWLYTGITRARSKVYLVGSLDAYAMAIKNNEQQARRTHLQTRLRKACAATALSNGP